MADLREIRRDRGLKQVDVAKKLDVTQGAVSRWENGESILPKYKKKLAKLYHTSEDELFGKEG